MSRKYVVYLMLALAVSLAGCCLWQGGQQPRPLDEAVAPSIALPSGDAQAPEQSMGRAPVVAPFDLDGARWMEYKLTANDGGRSTVRLEYGSSASGNTRTVSMKRTQTSNDAAAVGTFNGGSLFSFRSSSSQSSMTTNMVPIEQLKADDPVLYADGLMAGASGAETVTVPKGTYECKKYLGSFKGAGSTYWGAPGVPVPVKIYTACDGATLELVDWG